MNKDKTDYCGVDIPFSHLPIYQLLAKRHNLTPSKVELEPTENDLRVWIVFDGNADDKTLFHEDLGFLEFYENKLDEFFT